MTKKPYIIILLILVLFGCTSNEVQKEADEFGSLWKQEENKVEIRVDNEYLNMGQYIFLENKIGNAKLDIPENWQVEKCEFNEQFFEIHMEDGYLRFLRTGIGKLSFDILEKSPNVGSLPDLELEAIWLKYVVQERNEKLHTTKHKAH
ncbi:hypothetical protein [Fulvivirga lutea]|uniref:Uncharacterized protein n=1 Tax=Fulvivirga lutea TaxID=2810512 RepID=A0A974WKU9_9BACT|nr:hypothetical protein [Fulvivirga lutea]QSE97218.1 hypothetical protein JR347_16750 [Fulvivirga lutea]